MTHLVFAGNIKLETLLFIFSVLLNSFCGAKIVIIHMSPKSNMFYPKLRISFAINPCM